LQFSLSYFGDKVTAACVESLRKVVLSVCCLHALPASSQATTPPAVDPYIAPQSLATLPDGRRINLYCSGEGAPTVILTAGLNSWSIAWWTVQSEIAKTTRVCSWDRAGFGFSDPGSAPLDIRQSSLDLGKALQAAQLGGPYVLVGHSMGGLESLVFADAHRSEVRGMVLVDPTIPGQYQVFARVAGNFTAFANRGRAQSVAAAKSCALFLSSGKANNSPPTGCPPAIASFYPQPVVKALTPLQSDAARVLAQSSMVEQMVHSTLLGLNPRRNYGSMPLIVLSAPANDASVPAGQPTAFSFPPDINPAVLAEVPNMARELQLGHDKLAKLSTRGSMRIVLGTGHQIPLFRPEIVVSTIREVVELARGLNLD
jgi:pimeloyl-ACP methyl ester carboxylesterase